MIRQRVGYLVILACVTVFFICFDGYLSYYAIILAVVFPVLSLLVSLPGMLGVRAKLAPGAAAARKGAGVSLLLTVTGRFLLPSGRVKLQVKAENALTGEYWDETLWATASRTPVTFTHKLSSPTCGRILCRITKARVYDYAGLFSRKVKLGPDAGCTVLFYPAIHPAATEFLHPDTPAAETDSLFAPRPGEDPAELFSLREYREGDRASRIHWKLSEKVGHTLVKEMGQPVEKQPFFLLEVNGSPEERDALLDVFATLSARLSEQGVGHRVGYLNADASLEVIAIREAEELAPALGELLLRIRTGDLPGLREADLPPDLSTGLYLSCRPREAVAAVFHAFPGTTVRTVAVSASPIEGGAATRVRPGNLTEDLKDFAL